MSHMAKYGTAIVNPNPKLLKLTTQRIKEEFKHYYGIYNLHWELENTPQGNQLKVITDEMSADQIIPAFQQLYQTLATELALTQVGYNVATVKDKNGDYIVQGVIQ